MKYEFYVILNIKVPVLKIRIENFAFLTGLEYKSLVLMENTLSF